MELALSVAKYGVAQLLVCSLAPLPGAGAALARRAPLGYC